MGRRDELQSEIGSEGRRMREEASRRLKAAFNRLENIPLSNLTVGDLLTIIRSETAGHQMNINWGGRGIADAERIEDIATRVLG